MNTDPLQEALDNLPMVIGKLAWQRPIPRQWGRLYKRDKINWLIGECDLDGCWHQECMVAQQLALEILEYFQTDERLAKLNGRGVNNTITALNAALKAGGTPEPATASLDQAGEDRHVAHVATPVWRPKGDPAWSTDLGDYLWDLVTDGVLKSEYARTLLIYWEHKSDPEEYRWDNIADALGVQATARHHRHQNARRKVQAAEQAFSDLNT